jgi:two-component system NtrC family sensor kinase
MPSIRRKIGLGSAAFAAIIALLALLAYSDLRYLERRIEAGVAVYDFLDAVLDIRLEEKTFLLSANVQQLKAALAHAEMAKRILASNRRAFLALRTVGTDLELRAVEALLGDYTEALARYPEPPFESGWQNAGAEEDLQKPGESLVKIAEALAKAERTTLATSVKRSQQALLASIVIVALLGIAAARSLSRVSMRPLSWLEAELTAIAEGRNNQLLPISRDREIVSVSRAINRMLDEIQTRNRHLLQSEKLSSLGTLASGVAHELNNPLSNISSSCQILMEELEQQSGTDPLEWLRQIDSETERARHIVKSILDFSKENRLDQMEVNVREIISKSLLLMGLEGSPRIAMSAVRNDIWIYADGQRLQQVFINLFKNAIDAGTPKVSIQVRARRISSEDFQFPPGTVTGKRFCTADSAGRVLVIEVEDDGSGIPAELLPRVFDPFFTTKDVGHGDGLGLYVAQEIIDLHGGCVGISSQPGKGARILICLPLDEWQKTYRQEHWREGYDERVTCLG